MSNFSPREIVSELDRFIISQKDAKRAVAIALRNRWRRQRAEGQMREEVMPKNIPDDRADRRGQNGNLAPSGQACERAFRQGGGHQIYRSGAMSAAMWSRSSAMLVEIAITPVREKRREDVKAKAHLNAEERVLDALVGKTASPATRDSFRRAAQWRDGRQGNRD